MPPPPALPESSVTAAVGALTVNFTTLVPLAPLPAPEQLRLYAAVPAALGVTLKVPLVFWVPLQAPLAVQEVAFVDDQLSVALWPSAIEVGSTEKVTVGAGGGAAFTVSRADPCALPPAPLQVSV
jgi:hypothetical protein